MTITDEGIRNGMPAHSLGEQGWERPWRAERWSVRRGETTRRRPRGRTAVDRPGRTGEIYPPEETAAFIRGVKEGLADHLAAG